MKRHVFSFVLSSCLFLNLTQTHAMEGNGTADDPYLIATAEDLNEYCSSKTITSDAKLIADIVLNNNVLDENYQLNSGTFATWDKGVTLNACLDGNNHSISGLYIKNSSSSDFYEGNIALFYYLGENGIIKNLTIKDCYIGHDTKKYQNYYIGAFCAQTKGKIQNCHFDGCIDDTSEPQKNSYTGGICGLAFGGSISNCSSKGVINCTDKGAGIIGYNDERETLYIDHCTNYARIVAKYVAAGILAEKSYDNRVTISSCLNFGNIESLEDYAAGISAHANGIYDCVNEGSITGNYNQNVYGGMWTAGIASECDSIINCHNKGEVKAIKYVGGVCGHGGSIINCHNEGSVYASDEQAAGVCGSGSPKDSYNTGEVTASNQKAAGICIYGSPNYSYNTGKVTAKTFAAGIAINSTKTSGCFNTGDITAIDSFAAGIVAVENNNNSDEVYNCYNLGTVSSKKYLYGIAYDQDVKNCYNAGVLKGESDIEPLGSKDGRFYKVSDSYYNSDVCGKISNEEENAEYAITTEQLTDIRFMMARLDNKVWCMYEDQNAKIYYPQIKHFSGRIEAPAIKEIEFDELGFCKEHPMLYQPAPIVNGVAEISNGGQLFWYMEKVNYDLWNETDAILLKDIVIHKNMDDYDFFSFADISYADSAGYQMWRPLGGRDQYYRTFDGNGHTISGLICPGLNLNQKYSQELTYIYDHVGFVGTLGENAIVKNLTITDSYFSTPKDYHSLDYVGAIAGENSGRIQSCKVKNCQVKAIRTSDSHCAVGGVCGDNNAKIDSVDVISSTIYGAGGIAANNNDTITNCTFSGLVSGGTSAGIVANNTGYLFGCINYGAIHANHFGGVCYDNYGKIENCINASSEFSSTENGGSIIGGICTNLHGSRIKQYGEIINCGNIASYTQQDDNRCRFFGICVTSEGLIKGCYNTGDISSNGDAGGLVHENSGSISYSYNTGNISGKGNVGGIASKSLNMNASYATPHQLSKCINFGNISGSGDHVGGIAGSATDISNCCNLAEVSGNNYVGGIVGNITSNDLVFTSTTTSAKRVDSCYSVGRISGTGTFVGCIAGKVYSQRPMQCCYVNSDSCITNADENPDATNGVEYLTTSSMLGNEAQKNMTNLDFENIWYPIEGFFPLLWDDKTIEAMMHASIDEYNAEGDKLMCFSNNGTTYIVVPTETSIPLFNMNGSLIKMLHLQEGTNTINGLEKGVYILGNQKILVQ